MTNVDARRARSAKLEVGDAKERRVRNAGAPDVFLAALSPVEDDDEVDHFDARVAKHLGRAQRVPAGRDDVLDNCDSLSRLEDSFDLLRGPIALRLLANEEER
jgi:hypothetical protein